MGEKDDCEIKGDPEKWIQSVWVSEREKERKRERERGGGGGKSEMRRHVDYYITENNIRKRNNRKKEQFGFWK